jgi:hypothetical protein
VPDPSTTRLALYKSKSDGSELVSYTTDIGQNLDKLDAAAGFQVVTSSTRPSSPYSGKPIAQSDTSYSTYFSNGTAPASASWVEIPNSSSTFGSNLKLASTAQLTIGADVNLFRNAANVLRTNDSLIVDGNLTTGSTTIRPTLSAATTVANTVTQTAIATYTIPASDAVAGAVYRIRAWGTLGVTGTPTITFVCKLGGTGGATMVTFPAVTVRSGATDGFWEAEFYLACATTGGSGTWAPMAKYTHNFLTSVTTYTPVGPITAAPVTRDTTIANDMVLCATWGTASASNTITCRGFAGQRIA